MNDTEIYNPLKNRYKSDKTAYLYILSQLKKGELINDRYRIEEEIGQGGAGIVYKAFDIVLNNIVAIKFLNPELTSSEKKFHRIKNEVILARKITDERIIKIYSLERWNSVYFLVMEFIEGENLKNYIKKRGKLSWKEFKPFFYEILSGVKSLHKKNIIHRDLKPSNILITKDKKIKIIDFGLSKDIDDTTETSSIGEITGTPDYITPELVKGTKVGYYSDIYQLGMILYSVLSNERPFDGYSTTLEMIYMKTSVKPKKIKPNNNIPEYIVFAIEKAMEIEPENRFKSIDDFEKFIKKEKVNAIDKTLYFLSKKKKIILFLFMVLFIFMVLFVLRNNKTISKVDYKKSILKVYNPYGITLFEKNFAPYIIAKAKIMRIKTEDYLNNNDEKIIIVFLNHKYFRLFPSKGSIGINPTDAKIVYLNKKGEILDRTTDIMKTESYEFARKYYFESFKDYEIKGKEYFIAYLKHFGGMYPSALIIFGENDFPIYFYNPGMMEYEIKSKNKIDTYLLVSGFNNLFSHLSFFMRIKLANNLKERRIIHTIPQLGETRELALVGSPFFLSKHSYFVKAKDINKFEFTDYKTGIKILINIEKDKVIMSVKKGENQKLYEDDLNELNRVYCLINNYFYSAMVDKDYNEAKKALNKIVVDKIKNPFLKSAIYYFRGITDFKTGDFKSAEKEFKTSIKYEPESPDSIQKLCEIEFLKGNYKKSLYLSDIKYKNIGEFWGLTHMIGKTIFDFYIYMHTGEFFKGEGLSENPILTLNRDITRGILWIFKGDYKKAFESLVKTLDKRPGTYAIVDYRIFYIRAAILYELFSKERMKDEDKFIELARYYANDIYKNSHYKRELIGLSMAYYLLEKGKRKESENLAKEYFNKLLKYSKIDFDTKLWFFYDSFIYGKIMESLGNKKEAIRGYKLSIKSNPYTELSKRALERIKKIR